MKNINQDLDIIKSKSTIQCDIPNLNGVIWPSRVLSKAIEEYQTKIINNTAFGEFLHKNGIAPIYTNIMNVSHSITKLSLKDNGHYYVEAMILKTEKGKLLKNILSSGIEVKPTMNILGNEKDGILQEDVRIISINFIIKE